LLAAVGDHLSAARTALASSSAPQARALTMEPAELVNRTIARLRERGVRV